MTLQAEPTSTAVATDWHRIFDSLREEHDYTVDEVEGALPAQLVGTLYRNGPGINEVGGKPFAHLFDGHGMISQFVIDGGRIHYRNRFVRTHKYELEKDAQRPQVVGFGERGKLRYLVRGPGAGNAANTSVTLCADNLLALWEGGRPWALDPDTLATRGEHDFDGALKAVHAFSAHPKYDPVTGEMFNFGVEYFPRARIRTYKVDRRGRLEHLQPAPLPFPVMNHDFALTTKHMVFVLDPIVAHFRQVLLGRSSFGGSLRWDPSKPTHVVLVPRDGGKPRTIQIDPFFHFHVNNAYEDRGDTVVDLVRYDDYSIGENSLRQFRTGGFNEPGALWRLRVKPSGEVESHELCPWQCEFPQHDWRRTTLGHRFAYLAGRSDGTGAQTGIVKVDHEAGSWSAHEFGDGHVAGEPIFVPRSPESAEDDGWLLSVVYSVAEHRSRLVVLDARDVEAEPVAVAHLRHHVPLGFHGTFTRRVATPNGASPSPNGASA
jgi:all-trans-8'-apo-beta-carotenal 15,15'-oxygenase